MFKFIILWLLVQKNNCKNAKMLITELDVKIDDWGNARILVPNIRRCK